MANLRLIDVLARNIRVDWHEAVALLRDVCDRLVERPDLVFSPELEDIELSADGRVTITGGTKHDEPVKRLGQLLQALLAQAEPPVQLRLFVSQVNSSNPPHASVTDFSQALGYFERPDRAAVLAGLHARAGSVPAPEHIVPLTLQRLAPIAVEEKPAVDVRKPRKPSSSGQRAAAAAVLLFVAGVAYLSLAGPASARRAGAWAGKASDVLGAAVLSGLSSVTDFVGLGRLAPKESQAATPTASATATAPPLTPAPVEAPDAKAKPKSPAAMTPPSPRPRASAAPRGRPSEPLGLPELAAIDFEPTSIIEQEIVPAVATRGDMSQRVAPVKSVGQSSEEPAVYSPASEGVTAPIAVRPQLPRELPLNIDRAKLGRIELLIQADGKVGSVKLIGLPNNVHEAMFLSAVKAWEFTPALKDGRPVAYRKVVWVAFQ